VTIIAKVEQELVSVQGAEIMTGRSRWSWRRDAYGGLISSVKLGTKLLIPMSEIRRVIAEGTRPRLENPMPPAKQKGVRGNQVRATIDNGEVSSGPIVPNAGRQTK
jgi:hypothetical protein